MEAGVEEVKATQKKWPTRDKGRQVGEVVGGIEAHAKAACFALLVLLHAVAQAGD